jgi:hypothetical protein
VSVGLISGAIAGLVAGVGARAAMRLVALAGGVAPAFTIEGTLTILVSALLYGVGGGILYVVVRRRLPGSGVRRGLAFGLVVLLLFGPVYFLADQVDELHVAPVAGVLAFSALFVVGGGIIGAAEEQLERRLPTLGGRASAVAYAALGALGLVVTISGVSAIAWQVGLAVRNAAALLAGP